MTITGTAKDQLKSFVERIENLESEKAALASYITDLYAEAKSTGFDTKALRTIIKIRKQDPSERRDHETIVATYLHSLGELDLFDPVAFENAPRRDTEPLPLAAE